MTVLPCAQAAAIAKAGYSSIMRAARAAGTQTPRKEAERTRRSATGSLLSSAAGGCVTKAMSAPISRSVSMKPVRVGLTPTPLSVTSESSHRVAAKMRKAAELASPGTESFRGALKAPPPSNTSRRPPPSNASTPSGAPQARSMRSVWSRDKKGSMISLRPCAQNAKSNNALFTCALALCKRQRKGKGRLKPVSVKGSVRPLCKCALTPALASGASTRSIGRARKLRSPSRMQGKGAAASRPHSNRALVPELPQYRTSAGSANAPAPAPKTCHRGSSFVPALSMRTPSARKIVSVAKTSSLSSNPEISVLPKHRAERISARCEIDLSPLTRTSPESARLGEAIRRDTRWDRKTKAGLTRRDDSGKERRGSRGG